MIEIGTMQVACPLCEKQIEVGVKVTGTTRHPYGIDVHLQPDMDPMMEHVKECAA